MLEGPQAIVVAIGSAGSGKTACATIMGAAKLHSGEVSRIVITRAAVTGEESLGHLPGTLENKVLPFLMPIYDALNGVFGAPAVRDMVEDKIIEVAPLAYMRGRTFNDAWIILDEASSCTPNQMLMILTRVGHGSKLVITGDLEQSDLKGKNGLQDLMERLSRGNYPEIGVCRFGPGDVVRHPIVATVLKMYAEPDTDRTDRKGRLSDLDLGAVPRNPAVTRGTAVIAGDPVTKTVGFVTTYTKVQTTVNVDDS
jgi:phosphate starvation-inducible protein PhoH and related proteins